jgi:GTP-binding protein
MKFDFKYLDLQFVESAAEYDQCLVHESAEIAFVGASNAGKSSAINAISNQKKLAKVSKTPGKTKLFNFFKLTSGYIVDFPGYGYSKVSKTQKKEWSKELPKYFDMRKNLTGAIIFTDIRNPMRELDVSMFEMLHQRRIPILIVLTKSDKVSQETALETFNELEEVFGYSLCFSIKDKKSIGQLVSSINELLSN